MKLVSLTPSNTVTGHSPLRLSRKAGGSQGNRNAGCRVKAGGKTYMTITVKPGSRYRGRKGNNLSFHLVFSTNRYLMELQYKGVREDGRPATASITDPKSIQAVVTKFNANTTFNKHCVAKAILPAEEETVFDANFTGTGSPFGGGIGKGR
jgi:hypothetical protein